ncbi:type-F conjugative transfer system pilin assembly protein TrbC [Candidatus Protochlamydia amoebophila]|uniref:Type-F conjugative transfer system pilin assembly protein TrbC n=1 Tax=Protochlamydia amoebophila (strain UWE25) TaxID=264201 RepID=A0A2P9HA27_PARUW|nr:type-F conjugative transfer system pilin assembly protein TrbC [Candidatus Protochlamydia amoebophila]SPJ31866.1 unnamed protein product [Candidatus Protochlamydia amoebophila UWE25]
MRAYFLRVILLLNGGLWGEEMQHFALDSNWLKQAQQVDEKAVHWLKDHLKERLASENFLRNPLEEKGSQLATTQCQSAGMEVKEESPLYVFMSFSLDDRLWVQLSQELEKLGGIFVLRGLPQNSFKELANRIFTLQEQGVRVPIQIHPQLFQRFDIQLVPTIAVTEGEQYDKISGNLSIQGALEKMSLYGETQRAKFLLQQWKEQQK